MENNEEFEGHYVLWQIKRLNWILKHLETEKIAGCNLLELGCGHAFFGEQFSRLGANVLCVDGRKEHIDYVNKLLLRSDNQSIQTRLADLNSDFSHFGVFDIILDLGLLYHLEQPEEHIACLARMMHDDSLLVLETIVADYAEPLAYPLEEEGYDQSLTNRARILSPATIEGCLVSCGLSFEDISSSELNASIHQYDWPVNNSRLIEDETGKYFRKMWLVKKETGQTEENLSLDQQLKGRLISLEKQLADANRELIHKESEVVLLQEQIAQISQENQSVRDEMLHIRQEVLGKLESENYQLRQQLQKIQEENLQLKGDSRSKALANIEGLIEKYAGGNFHIGIFGAGEHTDQLFRTTDIAKLEPMVIFDNDRAKWALTYREIPINAPNTINSFELDLVIISSREYEKAIYDQLRNILDSKTLIFPLYGIY